MTLRELIREAERVKRGGCRMKVRDKIFLEEYQKGRTLEECFEMKKRLRGEEE